MGISRVIGSFVVLLGCNTEPPGPVGADVEELSSRSLVALNVTGVSVERGTGNRFILDANGVIYRLDEAAEVEVFRAPLPTSPVGYTDLVALGSGEFAITAASNGYLADLETGTMRIHFCYEPGSFDPMEFGTPSVQVTQAVTFDVARGLFYAQPRTIGGEGTGEIFESLVASYDRATGTDIGWWTLADTQFTAGGMAMLEGGGRDGEGALLLGQGSQLFRYDLDLGTLAHLADLSEHVLTITGLAFDEDTRTVLVIDAGRDLVELTVAGL
jgi:hypothetical protein